MNMTRRAFFMHPTRAVGDDMENVGEWLRRAERKGAATPGGGGGTETANEQAIPTAARGIGLKNARANIRRTEHEQHQ